VTRNNGKKNGFAAIDGMVSDLEIANRSARSVYIGKSIAAWRYALSGKNWLPLCLFIALLFVYIGRSAPPPETNQASNPPPAAPARANGECAHTNGRNRACANTPAPARPGRSAQYATRNQSFKEAIGRAKFRRSAKGSYWTRHRYATASRRAYGLPRGTNERTDIRKEPSTRLTLWQATTTPAAATSAIAAAHSKAFVRKSKKIGTC
jgi:hypothetical protein